MARFSKLEVLNTVHQQRMVPLYYNQDIILVKKVVESLYKGGVRLFEFTNRGDFAHEVFRELMQYSNKQLPQLILGVGSVVDSEIACLYMQNGADFIVSASFKKDIAAVCNRRKVPYMPGCSSLTEIGVAEEMGCDIVKLFPGNVYGTGFISSIKGPQPWTDIMVTGGVEPSIENLKSWFNAGATCVGMGSKLVTEDIVTKDDFEALEEKAKACLDIINQLK